MRPTDTDCDFYSLLSDIKTQKEIFRDDDLEVVASMLKALKVHDELNVTSSFTLPADKDPIYICAGQRLPLKVFKNGSSYYLIFFLNQGKSADQELGTFNEKGHDHLFCIELPITQELNTEKLNQAIRGIMDLEYFENQGSSKNPNGGSGSAVDSSTSGGLERFLVELRTIEPTTQVINPDKACLGKYFKHSTIQYECKFTNIMASLLNTHCSNLEQYLRLSVYLQVFKNSPDIGFAAANRLVALLERENIDFDKVSIEHAVKNHKLSRLTHQKESVPEGEFKVELSYVNPSSNSPGHVESVAVGPLQPANYLPINENLKSVFNEPTNKFRVITAFINSSEYGGLNSLSNDGPARKNQKFLINQLIMWCDRSLSSTEVTQEARDELYKNASLEEAINTSNLIYCLVDVYDYKRKKQPIEIWLLRGVLLIYAMKIIAHKCKGKEADAWLFITRFPMFHDYIQELWCLVQYEVPADHRLYSMYEWIDGCWKEIINDLEKYSGGPESQFIEILDSTNTKKLNDIYSSVLNGVYKPTVQSVTRAVEECIEDDFIYYLSKLPIESTSTYYDESSYYLRQLEKWSCLKKNKENIRLLSNYLHTHNDDINKKLMFIKHIREEFSDLWQEIYDYEEKKNIDERVGVCNKIKYMEKTYNLDKEDPLTLQLLLILTMGKDADLQNSPFVFEGPNSMEVKEGNNDVLHAIFYLAYRSASLKKNNFKEYVPNYGFGKNMYHHDMFGRKSSDKAMVNIVTESYSMMLSNEQGCDVGVQGADYIIKPHRRPVNVDRGLLLKFFSTRSRLDYHLYKPFNRSQWNVDSWDRRNNILVGVSKKAHQELAMLFNYSVYPEDTLAKYLPYFDPKSRVFSYMRDNDEVAKEELIKRQRFFIHHFVFSNIFNNSESKLKVLLNNIVKSIDAMISCSDTSAVLFLEYCAYFMLKSCFDKGQVESNPSNEGIDYKRLVFGSEDGGEDSYFSKIFGRYEKITNDEGLDAESYRGLGVMLDGLKYIHLANKNGGDLTQNEVQQQFYNFSVAVLRYKCSKLEARIDSHYSPVNDVLLDVFSCLGRFQRGVLCDLNDGLYKVTITHGSLVVVHNCGYFSLTESSMYKVSRHFFGKKVSRPIELDFIYKEEGSNYSSIQKLKFLTNDHGYKRKEGGFELTDEGRRLISDEDSKKLVDHCLSINSESISKVEVFKYKGLYTCCSIYSSGSVQSFVLYEDSIYLYVGILKPNGGASFNPGLDHCFESKSLRSQYNLWSLWWNGSSNSVPHAIFLPRKADVHPLVYKGGQIIDKNERALMNVSGGSQLNGRDFQAWESPCGVITVKEIFKGQTFLYGASTLSANSYSPKYQLFNHDLEANIVAMNDEGTTILKGNTTENGFIYKIQVRKEWGGRDYHNFTLTKGGVISENTMGDWLLFSLSQNESFTFYNLDEKGGLETSSMLLDDIHELLGKCDDSLICGNNDIIESLTKLNSFRCLGLEAKKLALLALNSSKKLKIYEKEYFSTIILRVNAYYENIPSIPLNYQLDKITELRLLTIILLNFEALTDNAISKKELSEELGLILGYQTGFYSRYKELGGNDLKVVEIKHPVYNLLRRALGWPSEKYYVSNSDRLSYLSALPFVGMKEGVVTTIGATSYSLKRLAYGVKNIFSRLIGRGHNDEDNSDDQRSLADFVLNNKSIFSFDTAYKHIHYVVEKSPVIGTVVAFRTSHNGSEKKVDGFFSGSYTLFGNKDLQETIEKYNSLLTFNKSKFSISEIFLFNYYLALARLPLARVLSYSMPYFRYNDCSGQFLNRGPALISDHNKVVQQAKYKDHLEFVRNTIKEEGFSLTVKKISNESEEWIDLSDKLSSDSVIDKENTKNELENREKWDSFLSNSENMAKLKVFLGLSIGEVSECIDKLKVKIIDDITMLQNIHSRDGREILDAVKCFDQIVFKLLLKKDQHIIEYLGVAKKHVKDIKHNIRIYLAMLSDKSHLKRINSHVDNPNKLREACLEKRQFLWKEGENDVLLLTEAIKGIRVREIQISILDSIRDKGFFLKKAPMGCGKTTIIPAALVMLTKGECSDGNPPLAAALLPAANYLQQSRVIQRDLKALGSDALLLNYDRGVAGKIDANELLAELQNARVLRTPIITTVRTISFIIVEWQNILNDQDQRKSWVKAKNIQEVINIFRKFTKSVVDEIDAELSPDKELILALSSNEDFSKRYLEFVIKFTEIARDPIKQIVESNTKIVESILGDPSLQVPEHLVEEVRNKIIDALTDNNKSPIYMVENGGDQKKLLEKPSGSKEYSWELRRAHYFLHHLLPTVILMQFGFNYGRSQKDLTLRTMKPYQQGRPIEDSEFSLREITLFLTTMQMLKDGFSKAELREYIGLNLPEAKKYFKRYPDLLSTTKLVSLFPQKDFEWFYEHFLSLDVDTSDFNTKTDTLYTMLQQSDFKEVREKCLNNILLDIVLPKIKKPGTELKCHPFLLSGLFNELSGMSGTALNIHSLDEVKAKRDTNDAAVMNRIIDTKTGICTEKDFRRDLKQKLKKQNVHALIDIGKLINPRNLEGFIGALGAILKERNIDSDDSIPNIKYILYYDGNILYAQSVESPESERKLLTDSTIKTLREVLGVGPAQWLTYYNTEHCRGTDIPQAEEGLAYVFLSRTVKLEDVFQGVMRMRGFKSGGGQKIEFILGSALCSELKMSEGHFNIETLMEKLIERDQKSMRESANPSALGKKVLAEYGRAVNKMLLDLSTEDRFDIWPLVKHLYVKESVVNYLLESKEKNIETVLNGLRDRLSNSLVLAINPKDILAIEKRVNEIIKEGLRTCKTTVVVGNNDQPNTSCQVTLQLNVQEEKQHKIAVLPCMAGLPRMYKFALNYSCSSAFGVNFPEYMRMSLHVKNTTTRAKDIRWTRINTCYLYVTKRMTICLISKKDAKEFRNKYSASRGVVIMTGDIFNELKRCSEKFYTEPEYQRQWLAGMIKKARWVYLVNGDVYKLAQVENRSFYIKNRIVIRSFIDKYYPNQKQTLDIVEKNIGNFSKRIIAKSLGFIWLKHLYGKSSYQTPSERKAKLNQLKLNFYGKDKECTSEENSKRPLLPDNKRDSKQSIKLLRDAFSENFIGKMGGYKRLVSLGRKVSGYRLNAILLSTVICLGYIVMPWLAIESLMVKSGVALIFVGLLDQLTYRLWRSLVMTNAERTEEKFKDIKKTPNYKSRFNKVIKRVSFISLTLCIGGALSYLGVINIAAFNFSVALLSVGIVCSLLSFPMMACSKEFHKNIVTQSQLFMKMGWTLYGLQCFAFIWNGTFGRLFWQAESFEDKKCSGNKTVGASNKNQVALAVLYQCSAVATGGLCIMTQQPLVLMLAQLLLSVYIYDVVEGAKGQKTLKDWCKKILLPDRPLSKFSSTVKAFKAYKLTHVLKGLTLVGLSISPPIKSVSLGAKVLGAVLKPVIPVAMHSTLTKQNKQ